MWLVSKNCPFNGCFALCQDSEAKTTVTQNNTRCEKVSDFGKELLAIDVLGFSVIFFFLV